MSRRTRFDWLALRNHSRRRSVGRVRSALPYSRRLRIEPLEDRRLLSITVNTLVDEADGNLADGDVSLRDAINLAAANDTINFSVNGTIGLTLGQLTINKNLTINGPGANLLTIDASGNDPTPTVNNGDGSRVLNIDDGNNGALVNVSIGGLTLTGGDFSGFLSHDGGAIYSLENLTVMQTTISGNSAERGGGGIWMRYGTLTINSSTISGNSATGWGGGIYSNDGLTVTDSTISGNSAHYGGGISVLAGDLTVLNCTISGNTASDRGGGIFSANFLSGTKITTITNSTISGNSAALLGGGICNRNGLTIVRYSTITDNTAPVGQGSGVASVSHGQVITRTEVGSTIIAGNINSDVDTLFGIDNAFQSNGHNLIGTGNATGEFVEPGDQTGLPNPLIGALADNGGPTMTHALLVGSPAIDMGDPAIVFNPAESDQRGNPFVRVFDGDGDATALIDIGSYERQSVAGLIVDTLADEDDADYSAGDLSLREAIDLAHEFVGAETITFDAALGGGTIVLTQGELTIHDSMTINGLGADLLTIDASGNDPTPLVNNGDGSRVFTIWDGNFSNDKSISISGLTLTGGDVSGSFFFDTGGGILSLEDLSIASCTISGNSAPHGGGIYNSGGNLTVTNSTISGNSTTGDGGAILTSGNLLVTHSTLSGNSAARYGGGVFSVTNLTGIQTTTITNSTISGNSAAISGGGIYNFEGLTVIRHSTITNNTAPVGQGSGIASFSDNVTRTEVHSTIIAGNTNSNVDLVSGVTNSFQSNGYNLIGAGNATGEFVEPGDQTGVTNPMLGPLADNGGPTMTHALLAGSPAINAGDPTAVAGAGGVPLDDQRDNPFSRVNNGRIDIGAIETNIPSPLVVDTLVDENDGDFSTGDLSLREAIGLARGFVGAETITFAAALTSGGPASIVLTQGELRIVDALTIDGPGAKLLTIDASGNDPTPTLNNGDGSRVFNIDNGNVGVKIDVEIVGLALTGGDVTGIGGGIRSFAENVSIVGSMITDNSATTGGGIHNIGGIGEVVTVTSSTISGNSADNGGGIYNQGDNLTVTDSTISGNAAKTHGGGISAPFSTVRLAHSTITGNVADSDQNNSGQGGGIAVFNNPYYGSVNVTLDHTIVAGNIRGASTRSDITGPIEGAQFSLIGDNTGASIVNIGGNQIGTLASPIDPVLGPLADNGGPTMTHALLTGSPAIDAGDIAAVAGVLLVPLFDQRGEPFTRVYDGDTVPGEAIDIGALEQQPLPAAFYGDYNQNGVVDAADYTVWRDTLGQTNVTPYSVADGSGDGTIGPEDYDVWKSHFGETIEQGADPATGYPGGEQGTLTLALSQGEREEGDKERESVYSIATPFDDMAAPLELYAVASNGSAGASPSQRRVPVLSDSPRDDALLAWLSSRSSAANGRYGGDSDDGNSDRWADDRAADESDDGLLDGIDAVFQLVGGGVKNALRCGR